MVNLQESTLPGNFGLLYNFSIHWPEESMAEVKYVIKKKPELSLMVAINGTQDVVFRPLLLKEGFVHLGMSFNSYHNSNIHTYLRNAA